MKRNNKLSKSIFSVALASTLAVGATPALIKNTKLNSAKADEILTAYTNNRLDNADSNFSFETYVNGTPELQGWKKIGGENAVGGILPTTETAEAGQRNRFNDFTYAINAYGTSITNPGTHDTLAGSSVLYIDSKNVNTFCTYVSNEITLSAYSFYKFSVWAYTNASETKAQFSLGKDLEDANTTVEITQTTPDWTQYTIYVATGYGSATNGAVKTEIRLSLGKSTTQTSTGHVFFDDASLHQIFEADYLSATDRTKKDFSGITTSDINDFSEAEFSPATTGWNLEPLQGGEFPEYHEIVDEDTTTGYVNTFDGSDNRILKLYNPTSTQMTYTTKEFAIERFGYYRLSFFSRVDYKDEKNQASANFNVSLKANLKGDNTKTTTAETIKPFDTEFKNTTPQSATNLWRETVYYIKGCPLYDVEKAWLSITIPANTTIYFDNFSLIKVGYTEYSQAKNTKLELTSTLPTNSFANGFFNLTGKPDNDKLTNLLPAQNWTFNATTTKDVYTIKNKDGVTWNFEKNVFKNALSNITDGTSFEIDGTTFTISSNPAEANTYYNEAKDKMVVLTQDVVFTYSPKENKFITEKFSDISTISNFVDTGKMQYGIDSSAIYSAVEINPNKLVINNSATPTENYKVTYTSDKFTAKAGYSKLTLEAKNASNNACEILVLDTDKKVLTSITIPALQTSFSTYSLYINSTSSAKTLYLQFVYADENTNTGALEIKQVSYKSSVENTYNNAQKAEQTTSAILDFTRPNFAQLGELISVNTYKPTNLTLSQDSTGKVYILRTVDGEVMSYQLVMDNSEGSESKSTTITTDTYTLVKSKFYKIVIKAMAENLEGDKSARLTISGTDACFDIKATDLTEYTLYIATGEADLSTNFNIELLDSKGSIKINEITITESNKTDFEGTLTEAEPSSTTLKVTDLRATKNDSTSTTNPDSNLGNKTTQSKKNRTIEILFATLSSLLLVGALIFALVFTKVNRKNKNKTNKRTNKVASEQEPHGFV